MLAQKQPYIQRVRNSSLVEERRSHTERSGGVLGRENAGMSSENKVRILMAEYPRYPG